MAWKHEFSLASKFEGVSNSKIYFKNDKMFHEHNFVYMYCL